MTFKEFLTKYVWYARKRSTVAEAFNMEKWKEEWAKETKLQKTCYAIRRFFLNALDFPSDLCYNIKYAVQRVKRGWSDKDVWSIDRHLSIIIPQMMRRLKKVKQGIPASCFDDYYSQDCFEEAEKKAIAKWDNILDTIIYTFETQQLIDDEGLIKPDPYTEEEVKKLEEFCSKMRKSGFKKYRVMTKEEVDRFNLGWQYFKQYWRSFWE